MRGRNTRREARRGFSPPSAKSVTSPGLRVIGQPADWNFQRLEQFEDVFVAGENKQLMAGGREIAENGGGGLRARRVEVDQHVVEHQRQRRLRRA